MATTCMAAEDDMKEDVGNRNLMSSEIFCDVLFLGDGIGCLGDFARSRMKIAPSYNDYL